MTVEVTDAVQPGHVTLPHGYGMTYGNGGDTKVYGPLINRLTSADHCDPIAKTPYHKNVPVKIEMISTTP